MPASPSPAPVPTIGHEVIIANAGCGKTEALAMRYLRLLRTGASAERIIALTFTRAAAGEFFERIVQLLARAAASTSGLDRLREGLDEPGLQANDCLDLLGTLLRSMPRLMLTTLDSFCFRIVQAYPFELGLEAPPEMIDSALAKQEQLRVLMAVLDDPEQDDAERQRFLRAIDLASFEQEERTVVSFVMQLVKEGHDLWLEAPDEKLWNPTQRLWRGNCPWQPPASFDPDQTIKDLARALEAATMHDKCRPRFARFISELKVYRPGAKWGKNTEFVIDKLLEKWLVLGVQEVELTIDRNKARVDSMLGQKLRDIAIWLMSHDWRQRLESTVGIGRVLAKYEHAYERILRSRGRLTFSDVLVLLSAQDGAALSQDSSGPDRLQIDYRLDARFDHWMLDEFQDTSLVQWRTLQNLIDEVVQDSSNQRTLFYVGDLKQSIYSWRGAAPQLFHAVRDHYNQGGQQRLPQSTLPESFRYRPAITNVVNQVFGDRSSLHESFGTEVSKVWQKAWVEHRSTPRLSQHDGYATVLQPDGTPDAAVSERRWNVVLRILQQTQPHLTGRSCAILVRKNSEVQELTRWLRRESGGKLPVTAVGRDSVATDNEIGRVLLHLLKLAVNPGDVYSWQRLLMCPAIAEGVGYEDPSPTASADDTANTTKQSWTSGRLATRVWRQVQRQGFESTLSHWLDLLLPTSSGKADSFNRQRGLAVVQLGRRFDRSGSRSVKDFLSFASAADSPTESIPGGIQVMTVHASKGLGFDMVILPELQGNKLDSARSGETLAVSRDPNHSIQWILTNSNERMRQMEPLLEQQHRQACERGCIENLCLLYVAMTRARHALYMIIDGKADSKSCNYPKLLRASLEMDTDEKIEIDGEEFLHLWHQGDPDWHQSLPSPSTKSSGRVPKPYRIDPSTRPPSAPPVLRLPRRSPSAHAPPAGGFFKRAGDLAHNLERRSLGNQVHNALEQVRWLGPDHQPKLQQQLTDWQHQLSPAAFDMVKATLTNPATKTWFEPIHTTSELWREQAFEMVLDGAWVSGVFDRVEVTPERVRLIDFKTSERGPDGRWPIDRHRDQMRLYCKVLARLLNRDPSQIEATLLYVTGPEAVTLE